MWIKAEDGALYNTNLAIKIGPSTADSNIVQIVEPGRQGVALATLHSPEEAQQLIDRIAKTLADGRAYFDVSAPPVSWEVG